jgi:hypothetical protein
MSNTQNSTSTTPTEAYETKALEMKTIIHDTVKQSCAEAIHESLSILGVDVHHPHETQADMHYLRRLRLSAQHISSHLIRSSLWAGLCGAGFIIYDYISRH